MSLECFICLVLENANNLVIQVIASPSSLLNLRATRTTRMKDTVLRSPSQRKILNCQRPSHVNEHGRRQVSPSHRFLDLLAYFLGLASFPCITITQPSPILYSYHNGDSGVMLLTTLLPLVITSSAKVGMRRMSPSYEQFPALSIIAR